MKMNRKMTMLALACIASLALTGCSGGGNENTPPSVQGHFTYAPLETSALEFSSPTPSGFEELGSAPVLRALNDAGQIAGVFHTPNGDRPFRHTGTSPFTKADALDLSTLPANTRGVSVTALSNSGIVTGWIRSGQTFPLPDQTTSAFTFERAFHTQGFLAGKYTGSRAFAINDRGQTAGTLDPAFFAGNGRHAFRHLGNGSLTASDDLGIPPGFEDVQPQSINVSGLVAGTIATGPLIAGIPSDRHAFVYDSRYHDLGKGSGHNVNSVFVNDRLQLAGYWSRPAETTSTVFRHTGLGPLAAADDVGGLAGFPDIRVSALNNSGTIVGTGLILTGPPPAPTAVRGKTVAPSEGRSVPHAGSNATSCAFVCFKGGSVRSLNDRQLVTNLPPGLNLDVALAINNGGQILGKSVTVSGKTRFWLLMPAP